MITLKEALSKSKGELQDIKDELKKRALEQREINAYIALDESGEGVPIAIKDNIQVVGWEVTCASKILKGYIAPYDATVIQKLRSNGLVPFGRTNMDEFAMGSTTETSCYGKTLNPKDPSRVPGGSSGGSAAAVAAGIAIAALGSDTGGSIRQPAAFCGVVGMKPTYGRVSRYGLAAYGSSLDQIGPMTQNVEDAAILYNIIAGPDAKDSTSARIECKPVVPDPKRKLKIGVVPNYVKDASGAVQKAYDKAIEALKQEGHEIVEVSLMDAKYDIASYYITAMAEASTNLSRYDGVRYGYRAEAKNLKEMYLKTRSEGFGEEVKRRILLGTFVLSSGYYDAYYIKAQKARHIIKDEYNKVFEKVDLILSPVAPDVAYEFGAMKTPLEMYLSDVYTIGVNLAGLPAISLPVDEHEGLPVGLQLIGKAFDEQTVFDGAMSLENALK
ncbi:MULTISPECIES: Asp-tRNA(Asn)/Glu-tRNA(Gln) amidotransferase subunit GatA [unclassified Nitratiruptor]|uniref:Asp-tRNA(Asn)/Glu-tRNA(Gln) amidotransferase subunit GatA n=1 Tax=unclassified Nitratiruptor TaxID=2624044 RepID=UPI0019157C99|nr:MULTISPECIES: Asp-tRNA(Asn)/Glu-tRNA(Gln) amidotransferase subunit GatA [unclassified Nitratiruptor]BCD60593.1 aspartyl-tRNA(Asn)/glutamyl-tRNA(Gln) amidotransferase subunit A [Nitratiruptor sp. YY08-10]BCD64524.1 aspartyl-tRNA(Asn)/glutamyl-tRNA(Gln) amidotransferase subunit A [Nitratiruptor sp. YY08-14]